MSEYPQESGPGAFLCTFGALPAVRLRTASGAEAILTLFGAHLVSWQPVAGDERLFCSSRSSLDGTNAIRGGVPVIFPQFGTRGDGIKHGVARMATWRLTHSRAEADAVFVECQLTQQDLNTELAHDWPHRFTLTLGLTLRPDRLDLSLTVDNTGANAFAFAAALHSYFRVKELGRTSVTGLQQHRYTEQPDTTQYRHDDAPVLTVDGKLDRIYYDVRNELMLTEPGRTLRLQQSGFSDAVVWNPGADDARGIADLGDDEYLQFICLEAATIAPHTLAPGAIWNGSQQWKIVA